MANVAKTHLFDKDIKNLALRDKRYFKVVGDPKELCVFVNPKGTKKFSLRLKQKDKVVWYELNEFREGIYSVVEDVKDIFLFLGDIALSKDKSVQGCKDLLSVLECENMHFIRTLILV